MAQQLLFVPVSTGSDGCALRMFRTPLGTRTAVAFTSEQSLSRVLGPAQPWIRLAEQAVRSLAVPLGADRLTVDPLLTARQPRPVEDDAEPALAVAASC